MNIDDSVDWYFDRSIGDKLVRGSYGGVYSNVGTEVGSGDGEGVEIKFGNEVGYIYGVIFYKYVNVGFSVGVGGSVCWGVYTGFCGEVLSAYGIIFGLDDVSNMGYSNLFFVGFNVGKYDGSLLYESLE